MKPVLILQNLSGDGPAWLARWLADRHVPFDLRDRESGQDFPEHLRGHSALVVLGGEMSANDELPFLRQAERLILQAMDAGQPVLGHCLGGQLMARALGARVVDSPAPEVGWQGMQVEATAEAAHWFGTLQAAVVFQWHFEAFELPAAAVRLARSAACPNQAFAIGPHLALQFHVEVDDDKVLRWSHEEGERWRRAREQHPGSVQDGGAMRDGLQRHLLAYQALADRLYRRWLESVPRT